MRNVNNIDILIGQKLKEARLKKDYTLEAVAQEIGLKQASAIGHYENGRRSISIENLIKICVFLELDYKELLDEVAEQI